MIIDDNTHFTLWHQTTDLEQSEADQADISNQDTVQGFVQRFTAAKRTTLSQLASPSEKSAGQSTAAISPPSDPLMVPLKQDSDPHSETTNQTVTSQPTQLKLDQQPPETVVPKKPLTTLSNQDCSTITVDPFSCPW